MDCVRFREVTQRYIDGELGGAELAWYQQHLSFCASCAADLDELSTVRAALAAAGTATAEVPVGFADRVCAAVASQPQPAAWERALSAATNGVLPGRLPRRTKRVVYGALVLLAVVIGWERRHERGKRAVQT